ncbi:MAG: extracellular solute-binding protein, partial [Sphaerochaetaceae bacterium]|nr:extracellular solute-binding protein [Sphaerochaetaceae bacterium]
MRKVFAIFCVMIIACTMIFAQAATESSSKGMTDITVMVYERGATINGGSTLDNLDTRWLNKQLAPKGVHITFVGIPRSGADATIETMIAAGTAPDVIVTNGRERVMQYGSQGGLVDFTPYLDRLDPEYQELIKGTPINMCSIDGGLYALPGMAGFDSRGHEQYIRKDIVEALGM